MAALLFYYVLIHIQEISNQDFKKLQKIFRKDNLHNEKRKVKFSQNFCMTISTSEKKNNFTNTEKAPGKLIRANK